MIQGNYETLDVQQSGTVSVPHGTLVRVCSWDLWPYPRLKISILHNLPRTKSKRIIHPIQDLKRTGFELNPHCLVKIENAYCYMITNLTPYFITVYMVIQKISIFDTS